MSSRPQRSKAAVIRDSRPASWLGAGPTPGAWRASTTGAQGALLVEQCGELLRSDPPVALGHEFTDLLPVGVVGEPHPDAITAGSWGEKRVANGQQRVAFVGSARNTSSGTGLPVGPSSATSKQNDLRRMSNECAVDLDLVSEASTRTVTSGSARHRALTRSRMSSGISMGELARASLAVLLTPNILGARSCRVPLTRLGPLGRAASARLRTARQPKAARRGHTARARPRRQCGAVPGRATSGGCFQSCTVGGQCDNDGYLSQVS